MLHEILSDYLEKVTQAILQCSDAYVERYVEEILTPERVNLRIRLRFDQGHLLEINEAVVVEDNSLVSLDYRYHCQDENNRLIFRYDSTPHFPNLSSFPHHKHLPDTVIPSAKPDINQIIKEAEEARM
ncbi:MAG: DUF6516 family protein [Gemmatimonadota bacterium]|nr:DUF6516 family protein [Gemmatimonadota bacterium]MDE2955168.1 DUF6516 family protein [Gemmatimonadota bacterium]